MIDTITFTLYDLKAHATMVNQLRNHQTGFRKFDGKGAVLDHEILLPEQSRRIKERFIYRTLNTASSHYKIIIIVDTYKDVINFTMSVPKYLYGHNIAQAVQNPNEIDFNFTLKSFDDNKKQGFRRLRQFIATFFKNEFPGHKVRIYNLELKRIDFCYNQIFRSKAEAFEYLELQKGIDRKYSRESTNRFHNYATSIFASNQHYSIKIYHKGTEYEKNDRKEHERINRMAGKQIFDTEYLQAFADRILRYETTIRPAYISYLYNGKIFRKNSKQFQTWKIIYNKIKSINKKFDEKRFFETVDRKKMMENIIPYCQNKIDKSTGYNFIELMQSIYVKRVSNKISLEFKIGLLYRFFRDFDTLRNTRRRFYFSLMPEQDYEFKRDNASNGNKFDTFPNVKLNDELFCLLADKLKEFILDMRIEEKKPISHYLNAIDSYNAQQKKNKKFAKDIKMSMYNKTQYKEISKPKLGMVLLTLQNYSMKSIKNLLNLSASTFYQYQADLKKVGYSKNTINNLTVVVPEFSYNDYFIEATFNQYKLFKNQMFKLEDPI